MRAAFSNHEVVERVFEVDVWALGVDAAGTMPQFLLFSQLLAGVDVNFEERDFCGRAGGFGAAEVSFVGVCVEEEAGIDAVEIEVNGIAPFAGVDICCGYDEVLQFIV
jgi:hypothetical protein